MWQASPISYCRSGRSRSPKSSTFVAAFAGVSPEDVELLALCRTTRPKHQNRFVPQMLVRNEKVCAAWSCTSIHPGPLSPDWHNETDRSAQELVTLMVFSALNSCTQFAKPVPQGTSYRAIYKRRIPMEVLLMKIDSKLLPIILLLFENGSDVAVPTLLVNDVLTPKAGGKPMKRRKSSRYH
ncbi:hypothetical protein BV898_18887 [Hypsibius exemplaris]|uniref:Uncharacterized protein n=1 Tax=Hypsibius exemplaris TaxID=2072580 RepID=A0A9X6RP95_HYPEX|nr:hypothetical protein BV898_18887 [Hypsibius exemplaris]